MKRAALVTSLVWLLACGGTPPRPDEGGRGAAALDDAVRALRSGAMEDALERAGEAARALPGDPLPREIAARASLALGRADAALRWTEGARDEPLVRLRAAAHLARSEHSAAARLLRGLPGGDEDPWAQALARIGRAAEGRVLHQREGAARAELPLRPDAALPVVAIRVEGRDALALIATSVQLTVLSPALRAEDGVLDELALGALRVRGVPFLVRGLELESAALGVELGAVIGLDVLARLGARIDGTRLEVGVPPELEPLDHATYDGTFLVARVTIEGRPAHALVDTAGAYALAITPEGAERLELAAEREGAGLGLGATLAITGVPLARDVMDDALESLVAAPVDGALGWGLLASLVVELGPGHLAIRAPAE